MKVNAPEKIYVQLPSRNWIGRTWNETPIKDGDNPNWKNATNIEYIRTDAFIEKALEFLDGCIPDYIDLQHANVDTFLNVDNKRLIAEFRTYMKGE